MAEKTEHKVVVPTPEKPHETVKEEVKEQPSENTRLEQEAGRNAVKMAEQRVKEEQEAGRKAVAAAQGKKE